MGCCNPNVYLVKPEFCMGRVLEGKHGLLQPKLKPEFCMGRVFEGKHGLLQLTFVVGEAQILYG